MPEERRVGVSSLSGSLLLTIPRELQKYVACKRFRTV